MFYENEYYRGLFDTIRGGPARAFECLSCAMVTKTEEGMKQHLRKQHAWREQPCLSSMESQSEQKKGKELRAEPLHFPSQGKPDAVQSEEIATKKSVGTKEGALLNFTKEEN